MLPKFDENGNLPAGIHWATWRGFCRRFGRSSRRRQLLKGLREALRLLHNAGCQVVYIDGSFVTSKRTPGDFDACWDIPGVDPDGLDSVFFDFSNRRAAQKDRFGGELFPAQLPEGVSGVTFLEFFQTDRETGGRKGIVGIRLEEFAA
jgi:hypothetical protein